MTEAISREVKNAMEGFPEKVTAKLVEKQSSAPGLPGLLLGSFESDKSVTNPSGLSPHCSHPCGYRSPVLPNPN